VRHNGVLVNGKRVNIPSYEVRPGDVVELTERAKGHLRSKGALEAQASRGFPEWLDVDSKAARGVFKSLPARTDLPSTINESLVVELYSR
jgi:small subunit ribosomal protein S4